MDLEGHDYKALVGAESLIKKYMPKIAVTTYHDINHASQIANFKIYSAGIQYIV
jgi:hypothetical protein